MVKKKRIKNLNVTLVSLVKRGANRVTGLLKGEDDRVEIQCLTKSIKGELHALVYVPDMDDSHGHSMEAVEVRHACHRHAINQMNVDIEHNCKPLEKSKVAVVENFILQKQDDRFPTVDRQGRAINHQGAWAQIIKINDPDLLALAESGELTEVSLFAPKGGYELVEEDDGVPAAKSETPQPSTMDEEKFKAAMAPFMAAVTALSEGVTTLNTSLKKSEEDAAAAAKAAEDLKKAEDAKPKEYVFEEGKPPVFQGNPGNLADIRKHQRASEDYVCGMQNLACTRAGDAEGLKKSMDVMSKLAEQRAAEDATAMGAGGSVVNFDALAKSVSAGGAAQLGSGDSGDLSKGELVFTDKELDEMLKEQDEKRGGNR